MLVLVLLKAVVAEAINHPLDEIIPGVWIVTRVNITEDALESLVAPVFRLKIAFYPETDYFCGELVNEIDQSLLEAVKIRINSEKSSVNVTFDSGFFVTVPLEAQLPFVKSAYGVIEKSNIVYSFVLMSAWRGQLTLHVRDANQLILYRCAKETQEGTLRGVAAFFSYFLRKSLFRFF
jgi:hypothetical protein